MCEYLEKIFAWSPGMNMVIKDEAWRTDPVSRDFIYTSTNVWSGVWEGFGPYIQEGMSVVKFREDEGCAYYQRDYFTEGDTWIGIPQLTILMSTAREEYLKIVAKDDDCFDADGDGWSKYLTTGCTDPDPANCGCGDPLKQGKRDCNDYDADVYPGGTEVVGNGVDDDCDGQVDETCSTFPVNVDRPLQLLPFFALFLLPVAFVLVAKKRLAKKSGK